MKWTDTTVVAKTWYDKVSYLEDGGADLSGVVRVIKNIAYIGQKLTPGWWTFSVGREGEFSGPFESEEAAKVAARLFCC